VKYEGTKSKYAQKLGRKKTVTESKIVQVISEWKKVPKYLAKGKKMVEAVVKLEGEYLTRHLAVNK